VAQWDVYANPSARTRADLPYLVVVQSDLLASLSTRFVAPLARSRATVAGLPKSLAPVFEIAGEAVFLLPQEAGVIDQRLLRQPLASLRSEAHRIIDALDAVISGI
jgi:toxin CcdB